MPRPLADLLRDMSPTPARWLCWPDIDSRGRYKVMRVELWSNWDWDEGATCKPRPE